MSLRKENTLVAAGQRLSNRIITLRSQSVIPTFVFRRVVLSTTDSAKARDLDTWSGLGSITDSDEHAIDYEPLGHAMVLVLDSIGGAMHDSGMMIMPDEMSSMALIEPYDILLQGDDRLRLKPDWEPKKNDLVCFMLNGHKEYHEVTGIMGTSMLAAGTNRYTLAQKFDLDYLDAFKDDAASNVEVPYE